MKHIRSATVATALALALGLAACTTGSGTANSNIDYRDLSGNDPEIVDQQYALAPGFVGYMSSEDSLEADEFTGHKHLNDQLIVRAATAVTAQQIADAVEPVGGTVVGINSALDDYQILLDATRSPGELDTLSYQLSSDPLISSVRRNSAFLVPEPQSADPVNDEVWAGHWGATLGNGDGSAGNWGMQAIGAPVIWDISDELSEVKVGVFDSFYRGQSNADIGEYLLFTVPTVTAPQHSDGSAGGNSHGLHVAGTIGAAANNGTGVAGVAPKVDLIGASYPGLEYCVSQKKTFWQDECHSDEFAETLGMSLMIFQGARIINYSMGPLDEQLGRAEQGNQEIIDELHYKAEVVGQALTDLVNRGHDFLVVVAAGNASGGMSEDEEGNWIIASSPDAVTESFEHAVSAAWNPLTRMRELYPELEERVLSVGAMRSVREFGGQGYEVATFSNFGADIVAPGVGIVSTMEVFDSEFHDAELSPHQGCPPIQCPTYAHNLNGVGGVSLIQPAGFVKAEFAEDTEPDTPGPELPPGYSSAFGTSMAAPHVSGVAAAMWSANPQLTAPQVREMIMQSSEQFPKISKNPNWADKESYPRLNAAAAIRDALMTLPSWHDVRDYQFVPQELKGTWCLGSDPRSCVNFADLLSENADSEFQYLSAEALEPMDNSGRTSVAATFGICLDGPCEKADDIRHFTYYPPGAQWHCADDPSNLGCDPDTFDFLLEQHDISWPRVTFQHRNAEGALVDAGVLKMDLRNTGTFEALPFGVGTATEPVSALVDTRDYGSVPPELRGTWCLNSDASTCINLSDYLAENPESGFDFHGEETFPQREPYTATLCHSYDAVYSGVQGCSVANSVYLAYFPMGVSWDCIADGAARFGFESCDPDFTESHRTDEPRIVKIHNHQHSAQYTDSEPLYRTPSGQGYFPNIHWEDPDH